MNPEQAALFQAYAAAASLLVSFLSVVVALAAVWVARGAKHVADEGLKTSKRQVAIAAIPYLVAVEPEVPGSSGMGWRLNLQVHNAGTVPALGIRVIVYGATTQSLAIGESKLVSERHVSLGPGASTELGVVMDSMMIGHDPDHEPFDRWYTVGYPFLVVLLDYYGPHGAHVAQSYDLKIPPAAEHWYVRHIHIDFGDDTDPIDVAMGEQENWEWEPGKR